MKFNGTTATPISWSATSIVVEVPVGATTGNVVVNVSAVDSNGVAFTVLLPYSVPDSRVSPNSSRNVQETLIYDVQTSSNPAIPPVDSRTAGAPVDCRTAYNIPLNYRTPGTYGPGE